jgi:plasmid stability protein
MGVMVQIRNVPVELHRTFKARAATAGMSMSEYLLGELRGLAERPSMETMRARLAALPETGISTAEILDAIRAERDRA